MSSASVDLRSEGNDSLLALRVSPKSSRSAITGVHAGALKVAVNAPPDKGKANAAVIALLARALCVSRSALSIEAGLSSRSKRVRVAGVAPTEVLRRLFPFLEDLPSGS
ncbi:MAG: DUF167 domain-containing protein [Planctomycetota bacterium]